MKSHSLIITAVFTLLFTACLHTNEETTTLTILLNTDHFDVVGVPETVLQQVRDEPLTQAEWQQIYPVVVAGETRPMLGRYTIETETVRFTPAFPLMAGQTYKATFSADVLLTMRPEITPYISQQTAVVVPFTIPKAETEPTSVTAVYPTAEQLPSNLLRFYVYFSAPMREGGALAHIALVDAQGNEVEGVFFDPIFELWDPSMKRLTLLFDPGRVKTGLRSHERLGRALIPGQSYSLHINGTIRDGNGDPLSTSYTKTFDVIDPDLTPPDVALWQLSVPSGNGRDPLTLQFPSPLDHHLLTEFVQIQTANGTPIAGQITVHEEETTWRFAPTDPWREGNYQIAADTRLEDIVGNNLHGLFDTPPDEQHRLLNKKEVTIPFQIDR